MSDRWFYRIYGQEFGPVSLDLVRTLVAAGTIAPDDEVRDAARSNWILACAASELRDSIKSPTSVPASERRAVRDEWFCRGAAGDFGPLTLSDLIQLAALGELKPDEDVKAKADDYWRQVRSIRRLVDLLPFADQNCRPSTQTRLSILVEDGQPLMQGTAPDETASSLNRDDDSIATFERSENRSRGVGFQPANLMRQENDRLHAYPTMDRSVLRDVLLATHRDLDDEVDILPFPGVQSRRLNTESANSFIEPADLAAVLAGIDAFEVTWALQNPELEGMSRPQHMSAVDTKASDAVKAVFKGQILDLKSIGKSIGIGIVLAVALLIVMECVSRG